MTTIKERVLEEYRRKYNEEGDLMITTEIIDFTEKLTREDCEKKHEKEMDKLGIRATELLIEDEIRVREQERNRILIKIKNSTIPEWAKRNLMKALKKESEE